ncbi:unnamed protein product [Arctia plantaginis]|uniref:Uncharacterized protein n=1 Tax=Arctia plantaginis TaxID=874455 RepID=A0A8S0Z197_ARCPL|nr:unnamed protein product [Arctia plantaginis]
MYVLVTSDTNDLFRESPVPSDPEHNIEKLSVLLKDVFDDKSEYMELEKMDDIKINNEEINENLDPNIIAYINISSSVKSVTAPSPVQIQKVASPAPSSPLIHQTPTPVPSPVQIHELCNSSFCVQCPEDIILIAPDDLYGNLPTPSVSSIANSATPTFTKGIKKRTYKNDKGKKRLVHKEDWIVTKSKLLKNQGKSYTNQKGKTFLEKVMKSPCCCRLKCFEAFTEEERSNLFKKFGHLEIETNSGNT